MKRDFVFREMLSLQPSETVKFETNCVRLKTAINRYDKKFPFQENAVMIFQKEINGRETYLHTEYYGILRSD